MSILKQQTDENQAPSWIRYIKGRIRKKKNFLALVCGATGSGKSWSCLSIGLMLDKNFSAERVVFGLKGLMELINLGENIFPAGTCFVWDEFQLEGGVRSWQSLTNRLINSLLTTFRHRNFILLINAPYSDFLDSQTRKLLHAEWETRGINYERETTILKPMAIQYNSRRQKFYYKYLRIKTKRGVAPITRWTIPKPPKWIIEQYEKNRIAFTTILNKDIERQLAQQDYKKLDRRKELTERQEQILELMAEHKDTSEVAKKLNITVRNVNFHLAQARKKGFSYAEFQENDGKNEEI